MYIYGLRYIASTVPWVELGGGAFLRWGFLRCRRWCDGLRGCSGCCGTSSWRDHLLGGSPVPPGAGRGAPRPPRRGLHCGAWQNSTRSPQPASRLDFFCSCYAWGAVAGGGGGCRCRGCGGRNSHTSGQGAGTMSSKHIPTYCRLV